MPAGMPEVSFHAGVADKLGYACRLLRKAWRSGARVVVTGPAEALARLDVQLWVFEHEEFVPHARLRPGEGADALLRRTPIWLAEAAGAAHAGRDGPQVLVNLGSTMPDGFERFERVIEVVSEAPDDAQQGRLRWRQYQAAGCSPTLHTAAAQAAPSPEVTRGPRA